MAVFVAVIVTPGIKAFVLSETVPVTVAELVCPKANVERLNNNTAAAIKTLFMCNPLEGRPTRWLLRNWMLFSQFAF